MEVILRQAVENLGHPGDIVKVSPGYARNYLLPARLRLRGDAGQPEAHRAGAGAPRSGRRSRVAARRRSCAGKLEQVSLTFSARVGEEGKLFGSVTSADIAQQLEAQGYQIEKRQIDLHEPIKALGVYRVPIRLHADVQPEIKVWVIKQ